MLNKKIGLVFLVILLTSPFLIGEIQTGGGEIGIDLIPEIPINYSLVPTVNSSDYWDNLDAPNATQFDSGADGKTLNILPSWLTSFITSVGNDLYCKLTGCEITGEVNITGNLNVDGDLNVTGISYLGDIIISAENITVDNIIPLTGGNVDLKGNLTVTEWFNGQFNWIVEDDWNAFDGSTLNFNETKIGDTYLNLSGTNANQNVNISGYNLTTEHLTSTDYTTIKGIKIDAPVSSENMVIGNDAGSIIETGARYNVVIGHLTGNKITTANYNTYVGAQAGRYNSGQGNLALGYEAMKGVDGSSTGGNNVALGDSAGAALTTGSENMLLGYHAGLILTDATQNVYVGSRAGQYATGSNNVLFGSGTGSGTSVDSFTGSNNIAIGFKSLEEPTSAQRNAAIGYYTGHSLTTGSYNTLFGYRVADDLTTGSSNTLLGNNAGNTLIDGGYNILIGNNILPSATDVSYELNIGNLLKGSMVVGSEELNLPHDNAKFYFGEDKNASINYDGTNLIIITNESGGESLAWFSNNVSATGYLTRTSVYDTSKGLALDSIKSSNELVDLNGEINHSAFYGYETYKVTDKSKPINNSYIVEECDGEIYLNKDGNDSYEVETCKNITKYEIIYPYTKTEEAVSLNAEIDVLREAVYELKGKVEFLETENTLIKSELCKRDLTYPWCK